jgi:hypothetical protein
MRAATVLGLAAALAVGVIAGWLVARGTASSETVTETATAAVPAQGLPAAVEATRAALLAAAESGDYEELRPLVPASLRYTFGSPVEGGAIAYWQELERTTGARPLETLAEILHMPYVLSRGLYVWPWAYTIESAADLSVHERELLGPLGPVSTLFPPGTGYLGWRAGIEPNGDWAFFVAGD